MSLTRADCAGPRIDNPRADRGYWHFGRTAAFIVLLPQPTLALAAVKHKVSKFRIHRSLSPLARCPNVRNMGPGQSLRTFWN